MIMFRHVNEGTRQEYKTKKMADKEVSLSYEIELLKKTQSKIMLEITNSINQIKTQTKSLTSRVDPVGSRVKDRQQVKSTDHSVMDSGKFKNNVNRKWESIGTPRKDLTFRLRA